MNDLERLALAALVHDLPGLLGKTGTSLLADDHPVLKLAHLEGGPKAILDQAEAYAMSDHTERRLVTDEALVSIFSRIQLQPRPELADLQYHPVGALPSSEESQDRLFPVSAPDATGLATHLQALAAELDWLDSNVDLEQFSHAYHHLLALLGRWTWCLPAHSQDVALFDHAKLTSAIAA